MKKLKIALFFGGRSAEHFISVQSARSVFQNLSKNKYEVFLIGISQKGTWYHITDIDAFLEPKRKLKFHQMGNLATLIPQNQTASLIDLRANIPSEPLSIDIAFPVLHGPYGEDGSFQGLLKCYGIPFVGSDILASALAMDKIFTKKLLSAFGFSVGPFVELSALQDSAHYWQKQEVFRQISHLKLPFFVKPANMGSSIGIQKVQNKNNLTQAIQNAFQYDKKAIVEEGIIGRELEVAVLGNENPKTSLPGEIIPQHDFYSYEAKYLDPQGATLKTSNLNLSNKVVKNIQQLAKDVFLLLECKGMARVDFFSEK